MGLRLARVAAVGMVLALGARGARAEVLGEGWPWRRAVTFKQAVSEAPGENVAWVEFHANGAQRADGADFRVTTGERVVVPRRVMQASGEDDLVRVAFATRGAGPYYVWWGNSQAEKPEKELEIKRGVLLELTGYAPAAGAAGRALEPQVPACYVLSDFVPPYNLPGGQRQVTMHYSAVFKIDQATSAQMRLSTTGTGTIAIDGREMRLGPARQPGAVQLAAGWHMLDIQQVNANAANPALTLSWQRTGEKAMTAFPPALVAPAARGVAGNLEKAGAAFTVDISPQPVAEVALTAKTYAQRYSFEAVIPENAKAAIQWDFGDGQTAAALRKVSHIFLLPGVYPVTLKAQPEGGEAQSTTVRLAIKERMFERFPRPPVDPAATVRAVLKDYNLQRLATEAVFSGLQFFETAKEEDLQLLWGRAWLTGREGHTIPADEVVVQEAHALARLQIVRKQFKEAAETFKLAAGKPIGMEARVGLMRHEVMTLCDDADDPRAALEEAQSWTTRVVRTKPAQMRTAQVALAYALLAAGDGAGAKAAIAAAGAAAAPAANGYAQLARQVDDAVAKKDLAAAGHLIDQWELTYPQALWDGSTRLLRVKLAAAEGRAAAAGRIAMAHAQANPDGPNAAELLFRAAENYKLAGEPGQAGAALDVLRKQHPDSPFARQIQPR